RGSAARCRRPERPFLLREAGRRTLSAEPFLLGEVLEDLDGLTPRGIVVEDVGDLLALELSAKLLLHEVHGRRGLRPVGGRDGEEWGMAGPVGRSRPTEAG